ncbi:MAG: MutS-related protein [Alkaliphilus sp.]
MKQENKRVFSRKDYKEIDFSKLDIANNTIRKSDMGVDKVTWHDLDMNNVFYELNYTLTTMGEENLFSWLKNPIYNNSELEERAEYINSYAKNNETVYKLRSGLSKIKYCDYDFIEIISNGFFTNNIILVFFLFLSSINIGVVIYTTYTGEFYALIILVFISFFNMMVHYGYSKKYQKQFQAISYALRILNFCKSSINNIKEVDPKQAIKLKNLNRKLAPIRRKGAAMIRAEFLDFVGEYVNIVFLIREINFLMLSNTVNKCKNEIAEMYKIVGEIDSALSINCYRNSLDYYCEPNFSKNENTISLVDMYHPLLNSPVSNSINVTTCIAITGSNMSGKSTFLRTIGLNTLFAQTICTSLSREHTARFYRLITSISLNDDIVHGKSYFMMEAEAIKRMVNLVDDKLHSLVLIDEIFKGTNPIERVAAAMEILNLLAAGNTRTFVATHDLQILPELIGYQNFYFTEQVTKNSLDFNYKIHRGITSTRNAIKILEFLEYPNQLVKKINNRIENTEILGSRITMSRFNFVNRENR